MLAFSNENKIKNLSVNEYFFLTENLEFADESEIQSAVGFLIINKKKNLYKALRNVIENELDETEKMIIKLHFYEGLKTATIVKKCNMASSSVYRNLESGLKKIETSLKYVLEYEDSFKDITAQELLMSVKGEVN